MSMGWGVQQEARTAHIQTPARPPLHVLPHGAHGLGPMAHGPEDLHVGGRPLQGHGLRLQVHHGALDLGDLRLPGVYRVQGGVGPGVVVDPTASILPSMQTYVPVTSHKHISHTHGWWYDVRTSYIFFFLSAKSAPFLSLRAILALASATISSIFFWMYASRFVSVSIVPRSFMMASAGFGGGAAFFFPNRFIAAAAAAPAHLWLMPGGGAGLCGRVCGGVAGGM